MAGAFSGKQWKLQYRATRDGFTANNFHSMCNRIANTLTIIKSEHGNILGGFTEKAWNSSNQFYFDPNAFIFSFFNKENKKMYLNRFKANKETPFGIYCDSTYGPIFGGLKGRVISIASNSNLNQESFSASKWFNHSKLLDKTILSESANFQTLEIEVFTQTN